MALSAQQKRDACHFLHPTIGFRIENDGTFQRWMGGATPQPTEQELEDAHALLLARRTKLQDKANDARQVIVNNAATIRQLSKNLQACQDFVTTDADSEAKTLYLLTNLVVYLANDEKLEATEYID